MKKVMRSLPGVKTVVAILTVCVVSMTLISGEISTGLWTGTLFAASMLVLLTMANFNPDAFEAWSNPSAYSYRTERNKVLRALESLTDAIEEDGEHVISGVVLVHAAEARQVIDEIKGRHKATAR